MNTIEDAAPAKRGKRRHSAEFKTRVMDACGRPGVSTAAVALANGVNANMLRRWVVERERADTANHLRQKAPSGEFVELTLPKMPSAVAVVQPSPVAGDIRIELRRGATAVTVNWPIAGADECGQWLLRWLK